MASEITLTQQNLVITEIGSIAVTPITQDTDVGDYVRDIRIFGPATILGSNGPMLVQLRLRATSEMALHIAAPAQEF